MSVELNVDSLLESNPADKEQVKRIAKAYSTALALTMINGEDRPFARVSENVQVDHGECRRQLTIDWHLPTLTEALPGNRMMSDTEFISEFNEINPVLVVPIFIVRKGRLMNN